VTEPPVFVSRFAEPTRAVPVPLGPCRCPGSPHAEDQALVRAEIGDGEFRSAVQRGGFSAGPIFDAARSDDEFIATFTLSWTLLDDSGEPAPITPRMAGLLDEETRLLLLAQLNKAAGRSVFVKRTKIDAALQDIGSAEWVAASELLGLVSSLIASSRPLPNASGAPSRASSRGSASRARAKPRG
jgi:hypothetical protein